MSDELRKLINQTPDVIGFLRSQIPYKPQRAADQEPTAGGKPKSRPPLNVDAVDAADRELEELAFWADLCEVPFGGWVRRVGGVVRGVLYDDPRPARDIVVGFGLRFDQGWVAPEGMLTGLQSVRFAHFRLFPELDSVFGGSVDELVKPDDDGQLSMWEVG